MEKQMEQPITKTQIMLELLAERGSVISSELCKSAKASGVKPFLLNHMARGEVVFKDSPEGKIYSFAPGVTLEQLQANKGLPVPKRAADPAQAVASHPSEAPPVAAPQPVSPAEPLPVLPAATIQAPIELVLAAPQKQRFRVAVTSDQTIMLFGLTPQLIELDKEQTKTLAGFVYEKSDALCS